jgi:ATP-dependent protease HslVU (ClpYQ) peptidase subunit
MIIHLTKVENWRRLVQRDKRVTICAAVIHGPKILTVHDSKLSFFGGSISADGIAWKERRINRQWVVLFSGDVSPLTPLLDAIEEAAKKASKKDKGLRQFARLCARAYRAERERIIEDEILPDYDLWTYGEYLALKTTDSKLFDAITAKVSEAEEGWHLLFCGFDDKRKPHLFVISGRGKIEYCDTSGFAAIGSGGWAAHIALASYPYTRSLGTAEATYCLLAAKFASESAEGVGKDTVLRVLTYANPWSSFMFDPAISNIREMWRALPRMPVGAAAVIDRELSTSEGLYEAALRFDRHRKKKLNNGLKAETPAATGVVKPN